MSHKLSVHAGEQPTGLDKFRALCNPRVIYCLNNTLTPSPDTILIKRVQNDVWGRLPDAMQEEDYFLKIDSVAAAQYEMLEKLIYVPKIGSLNLIDYWKLGYAHYYAPYNEPDLGASVDHILKAHWLNGYTCEALRIAQAAGLKLCIFSFASGNPHPDCMPYLAEAAKLCAEYGGIIDLHAYGIEGPLMSSPSSGALFYRQFHDALPVCPPIVLSEFWWGIGFEEGTSHQAQIADAIAYGTELEKDPYLLGACAFQLNEGAESNIDPETLLAYATQVAAVEENMPFIFGVHATSSPGPLLDGDIAGITASAKFNGYKFLSGDPPDHYAQIAALGIPPANCITRLFMAIGDRPKPTPAQFCEEQGLAIVEAMAAGVIWFEIHNEPNLAAEWPYSTDPHDFIAWCLQVVALLREQHPGIKLISPGLSPQPNTPTWWQEMSDHGLFTQCDAIGAHVYWPSRPTMLTQAQGLNFIPLVANSSVSKPIFVTEYNNNIGTDEDYEKGLQYVDWSNFVKASYPTVTRAYLYIISSGTPAENVTRQTIVRSGVVSAIADGIKAGGVVVPPAVVYQFDHSHLDGGPAVKTNPLTLTMNADHALEADYVVATPIVNRFFLTARVNPAGAGTVTFNPAQPVDGYPAGTIVTVTFN